jgi:hypothetical protein
MMRVILSVVLFFGVLALIDYALTGGDHVHQVARLVLRMLS